MDEFDRAQELEMAQREEALARHRARFSETPGLPGAMTALDCMECGQEIPEARRRALPGIMVCVKCKDFFERTGRMP